MHIHLNEIALFQALLACYLHFMTASLSLAQVSEVAIALLLNGDLPQPTQLEKQLNRLEAQLRKVQKVAMG